jgi:NADPH-dependent 2,4-dienoyl-CoA reductase/sulfur reductase-like enzyme
VRPDSQLAQQAGAALGIRDAIAVDRRMRANLPDVFAAGDCVETWHRMLGAPTYMPLGTTVKGALIQIMPLTWDSFLLRVMDMHPWQTI